VSPVCCLGHRTSVAFKTLVTASKVCLIVLLEAWFAARVDPQRCAFPCTCIGMITQLPILSTIIHPSSYSRTALERSQSFDHCSSLASISCSPQIWLPTLRHVTSYCPSPCNRLDDQGTRAVIVQHPTIGEAPSFVLQISPRLIF
jgi:hypothetical protein